MLFYTSFFCPLSLRILVRSAVANGRTALQAQSDEDKYQNFVFKEKFEFVTLVGGLCVLGFTVLTIVAIILRDILQVWTCFGKSSFRIDRGRGRLRQRCTELSVSAFHFDLKRKREGALHCMHVMFFLLLQPVMKPCFSNRGAVGSSVSQTKVSFRDRGGIVQ